MPATRARKLRRPSVMQRFTFLKGSVPPAGIPIPTLVVEVAHL
jgi:hypothetical protein